MAHQQSPQGFEEETRGFRWDRFGAMVFTLALDAAILYGIWYLVGRLK